MTCVAGHVLLLVASVEFERRPHPLREPLDLSLCPSCALFEPIFSGHFLPFPFVRVLLKHFSFMSLVTSARI